MNRLIGISLSSRPDKKLMAVFSLEGKQKIIHFGSKDSQTFAEGADDLKRLNYVKRHKVREDFNNPFTAGSLAYHILWTERSMKKAIENYKNKFDL